ncbi:MAG: sodium:solute symporter family protein [Rickettsiaceae bacterium]|nr:sodium:solute symporter family protein [Rickettsiaceae bacterium]
MVYGLAEELLLFKVMLLVIVNFNTGTLVATIVATWVGGGFFSNAIIESYKEGLIFVVIFFADFLSLLVIGLFFAPRLSEFLGKISIAEAMGELYGPKVRVITAVTGFIGVSGIIAIQLQIAGHLFDYAFGLPLYYGIIISGIIITLYSSLGGIQAVTFTDVIQFITFGIVIPSIALMLFKNLGSDAMLDTISNHPKFDYKEVFSSSNPQIYYYSSVLLWFLIPGFNPGIFQRISMAKDIDQVKSSFTISAFIQFSIALVLGWVGLLLLSEQSNLQENDILKFIISDYHWVIGFKGIILAAIMAMIMSTVDSYINSNSILLVHDLKNALDLKFIKNELLGTRICAAIIGTVAILVALRGGNFFKLLLWTSTCYMPIVTVPFIMSLFGFRSTGRSVLAGMIAGFVTVVIWELFLTEKLANVGSLIPAMLANLAFLLGYHYLFNQKGGWVGIKDPNVLVELRRQKKGR